jgi:hypothetical protein
MIEPRAMFVAVCDKCKSLYEGPYDGWQTFDCEGDALDTVLGSDWMLKDNKLTCESCREWGDSDE